MLLVDFIVQSTSLYNPTTPERNGLGGSARLIFSVMRTRVWVMNIQPRSVFHNKAKRFEMAENSRNCTKRMLS